MEWILIFIVAFATAFGMFGKAYEIRMYYLEHPNESEKAISVTLAILAPIPAFFFVFASKFEILPIRIYLWVLFLGLVWIALLYEVWRRDIVGDDPKSFAPLLIEKLADLGKWLFAGGLLGLLMLFAMRIFTPTEIGTARIILVRLTAFLKFLKLGAGATILLLTAILIVQWRFPKRKEILERFWKQWSGGQRILKRTLLVMTSLFCFSYTGTFQGGSITPLMHKIDLVEKNYRELVWRAEIELSADLRIEAYRQAYATYSPQLRSAIQTEIANGQRAALVPAKYLPAHFLGYRGYRGHLPSDFQSDGDRTLAQFIYCLEEGAQSDRPPVPDDVPMQGLLTDERDGREIVHPTREPVPDWLSGLPGELLEKIVDRSLDVGSITFIEEFSNEFPLIGKLVGTVDEQLNALFTEKMKAAAGRIALRRARGQIDELNTERLTLISQAPDMRTNVALQGNIAKSRVITRVVDTAERAADHDLRVAIEKELTQAAKTRPYGENSPSETKEERSKAQQETRKVVEEMTKKYRYEYLLQLREFPESAYRAGTTACCAEHELLIREHEAPSPRPRPVTPHEFIP